MADELQSRFEFDAATQSKFEAYHADNPQIFEVLKRFALEARRAGRMRLGIKMLCERVRWYTVIEAKNDTFKINNSWTAYYARKLMVEVPELDGMFETRKAKADAEE